MATKPERKKGSSRERTRAWRARMRAKGLRPVTLWVPDTRTDTFREQAAREARAVAASEEEADVMAFLESVTEWPPDETLRAKGLRPVIFWLPDTARPEVRERLEKEYRAIAASEEEAEMLEWLEAVADWPEGEDDIPDYVDPDETVPDRAAR